MRILLTGAFGNLGAKTLAELVGRGHRVRCFDTPSKANLHAAERFGDRIELRWGDIRRAGEVQAAVAGQDAVIHLAFVIPRLSATGVNSEDRPDWAREVNVGGTMTLLAAMKACAQPPRLIFASSLHVYGRTQHLAPPRTVADRVQPVENYALHKVTCEEMVKASGLEWSILRLGASMPIRLILDPGLFDVPLDNRIEFVHGLDVAVAMANAVDSSQALGNTWLVGGGPRCQHTYREIAVRVLEAVGIGMLPEDAFSSTPFSTDWLDTAESQRVLRFQKRTFQDYLDDLRRVLGPRRYATAALRPILRRRLLGISPYYRASLRRSSRPSAGAAVGRA
jgi:nucleoside-diphosphate-sugar epimerase